MFIFAYRKISIILLKVHCRCTSSWCTPVTLLRLNDLQLWPFLCIQESLRILQWKAGELSQPKRVEILETFNTLLRSLYVLSKQLVLQWISGHGGVAGKELADYLVKQGASTLQISRNAISFNNIKLLIRKKIKNFIRFNIPRRILRRSGGINSKVSLRGLGAELLLNFAWQLDTTAF